MGTKTIKAFASKEQLPHSMPVEECFKFINKTWFDYAKGLLEALQTTIESPDDSLSEEELSEISSEDSFECEFFKWEYFTKDEPGCVTGTFVVSIPGYTPAVIGTNFGYPSQYPWLKFSETFSND